MLGARGADPARRAADANRSRLGVSEAIRLAAATSERSARSADESLWASRERLGASQRAEEVRGVLVDEPTCRAVWVDGHTADRVDREAAVGRCDLAIPAIGGCARNRRPRRCVLGTRRLRHAQRIVEVFVPALTIGAITVAIVAPRLC
jgi:hypothetical protein